MKFLLALTFFTSTLLNASTVHLNVGDSITLNADTVTTVTCNSNGNDNSVCGLPVRNLKVKFDYCKSNLRNSTLDCLNQVWYTFKRTESQQCVGEGFETCMNFCRSSITTLDCLNICE
jgi:hypothetical protein